MVVIFMIIVVALVSSLVFAGIYSLLLFVVFLLVCLLCLMCLDFLRRMLRSAAVVGFVSGITAAVVGVE